MNAPAGVSRLVWLGAVGLAASAAAQPANGRSDEPAAPALSREQSPPIPPEYLREERNGLKFAYHPSARDGVRPLLEQAEGVRAELCEALGANVLEQVAVRVAWGQTDLSRHRALGPQEVDTPAPFGAPQHALAAARGAAPLLTLDLEAASEQGADGATRAFRRAMALHALGELGGTRMLPGWLTTGFSRSFAGGPGLQERLELGWALSRGQLIAVRGFDVALARGGADGELGAAEAADWVGFLRTRADSAGVPRLVGRLGAGEPVDAAVRASFNASLSELESRWRSDLGRRAVFVPLLVLGLVLAAMVLGLLAGWRALRRRHASRAAEAVRLRRVAEAQAPRLMPVQVRLVRIDEGELPFAAALHLSSREELGDPDVPKISHDNQWHTLH